MRKHLTRFVLSLGLLALGACSPMNSLSGSVSELFSLTFNSVDVRSDSEAFVVTYYFTQSAQTITVIQLHIETDGGVDFTPGNTIDLSGYIDDAGTRPRTSVIHFDPVAGQSPVVLPPVLHGSLSLGCSLQVGQSSCGSFSMSFVDDGTLGSNRTLTGGFNETLQDGEFPPDSGYYIDAGPWDAGADGGYRDCGGPGAALGSFGFDRRTPRRPRESS